MSPSCKNVEVFYTLGDEVLPDYDSSIAEDSIAKPRSLAVVKKQPKLNVKKDMSVLTKVSANRDKSIAREVSPKFTQVPLSTFTGGDFSEVAPYFPKTTKFSSRHQTAFNVSKIPHLSHIKKDRVS